MSSSIRTPISKIRLIEIVQQKPDLWRLSKKAPSLKQKMWHDVGRELGTSGGDARRQWEILRDQFRREFKRAMIEKDYTSRWAYYEQMLFLRHAMRPRDGHAVNSDTDTDPDQKALLDMGQVIEQISTTEMQPPKIQVRQDLLDSMETTVSMDEASTSAAVSSSSRHRLEQAPQQRRKTRWWRKESTEDEDYHFVMSILPSLRNVQQSRKLRMRSKIMELISRELELGSEEGGREESPLVVMKFEAEADPADFM